MVGGLPGWWIGGQWIGGIMGRSMNFIRWGGGGGAEITYWKTIGVDPRALEFRKSYIGNLYI